MTLEDQLIDDMTSGKEVSIERALLIVSGCETEEQIAEYTAKVDRIQEDFRRYFDEAAGSNWPKLRQDTADLFDLEKAALLFTYLWETKPNRYNSDFLLKEVIDAQLSEDRNQRVGDCVGLTSLYTVLGLRKGLKLSILCDLEHVLSVLNVNDHKIPIENTIRLGFNHCNPLKHYSEEDLTALVALVLNCRGALKKDGNDPDGAMSDYNNAIRLKPDFAEAFYNRGKLKHESGDKEGAMKDYNIAIGLNPNYAKAYNNRGILKYELGDLKGAMSDYNISIESKQDYALAFGNRGALKQEQGDLKGALDDFRKALEHSPDEYKLSLRYMVSYLEHQLQ